MADQPLIWRQCADARERPMWCSLEKLDTSTITATQGVYVVWHGGEDPDTLRVGQAFFDSIAASLERLRDDAALAAYRDLGLFVTWAEVTDAEALDGIERYIADALAPLLGKRPNAEPIEVNLPWDS